ncbi:MAG: DUF6029 family protein [Chitinophagales bacterium]|jgi:hypothetical protein|nr:DUF6029 family protein [Chitinophagales bacterium]
MIIRHLIFLLGLISISNFGFSQGVKEQKEFSPSEIMNYLEEKEKNAQKTSQPSLPAQGQNSIAKESNPSTSGIAMPGGGVLRGNLRINNDFYDRDENIGAIGANYDNKKTSTNTWLQMIYLNNQWDFEAGLRLEIHQNSILQNPNNPYSGWGIANWYIKKKINFLEVQGGYIYEQFGSGATLRSFEERNMGIDNAIFGARIKLELSKNVQAKFIAGVQKFRFDYFQPAIKGINIEGTHSFSDKISITPGASLVNRTLDETTRQQIYNTIAGYPQNQQFEPVYNAYVYSVYNTLSIGKLNWFVEYAGKRPEAIYNGNLANPVYKREEGYMLNSNMSFEILKTNVTLQYRRMKNFQFLSQPNISVDFNENNNKRLSFVGPMNKQNALRLLARFQTFAYEFDEQSFSIDISKKLSKHVYLNLNASNITSEDGKKQYFQEAQVDLEFKKFPSSKFDFHLGFQYLRINQMVYIGKGDTNVLSYTPFLEMTYRIDRKKSLRMELQYQESQRDLGKSVFALLEFNIAPKLSLAVSDLFVFEPYENYFIEKYRKPVHFYSAFASYNFKKARFTIAYIKQLEGIVCTGGVCRLEPAFSGVRTQFTTEF